MRFKFNSKIEVIKFWILMDYAYGNIFYLKLGIFQYIKAKWMLRSELWIYLIFILYNLCKHSFRGFDICFQFSLYLWTWMIYSRIYLNHNMEFEINIKQ